MAKKKFKLFGLNGLETDAWEVGTGVGAAVLFDVAIEKLLMEKKHAETGRDIERGHGILSEAIEGIEGWTGMKAKPVLMAGTGILMMRTEYRELGKALAYIGSYNALTSHHYVRRMGAGMHGIESKDVLAAIETGIQERMEAIKKSDGQDALADPIEENVYDEIFKKSSNM